MINSQITIGIVITGISIFGWLNARRVLQLSNVMRRLAERRGDELALRRVQTLCLCGAVFGVALASGLINPLKWE